MHEAETEARNPPHASGKVEFIGELLIGASILGAPFLSQVILPDLDRLRLDSLQDLTSVASSADRVPSAAR
jgi:hypothetical protein